MYPKHLHNAQHTGRMHYLFVEWMNEQANSQGFRFQICIQQVTPPASMWYVYLGVEVCLHVATIGLIKKSESVSSLQRAGSASALLTWKCPLDTLLESLDLEGK